MITFEFEGKQFEADSDVLTDYEFIADILEADEDPRKMIRCFHAIFAGRDREYARAIGGKFEKMGELLKAAFEAAGDEVKN
jgi:hypothetical protein